MMNTPPSESYSTAPQGEIPQDTPVFDVNADKVGTVVLSALRDGYFVVEKGLIFTHELYLPATAIQSSGADGIRLRLSKDELKDERWKQPPAGYAGDTAAQPQGVNRPEQPGMGAAPNQPVYPNQPPVSPAPEQSPQVHQGDEPLEMPPPGSQPPLAH
jgi:hypothetical protein